MVSNSLKKVSAVRFFILFITISVASNFIHPVTPTLFTQLDLPKHMFGTAFAMMATATFLFAPMWGKISDKFGKIPTLCVAICGYAVGQIIFGISTNSAGILLGRFVGGAFMGGFTVTSMAYIVDMTVPKNRAKYLTYLAVSQTMSAAIGYLIGGLIGDYSIPAAFVAQVLTIFICSAVMFFVLAEPERAKVQPGAELARKTSINPFKALLDARKVITIPMLVFLISVFVTSFASMAHDNAFNYYMKDVLEFQPSYNGMVKAVIGIVGLVANFTVNMWLSAHTNLRKSIIGVLSVCAAVPFVCVLISGGAVPFIIANIVFYAFNAMWLPMQQTLAAQDPGAQSSGTVAGLYTSAKSLGMIFGPLFVGFIYNVNPKAPFVTSGIAFAIAAIICTVNFCQFRKIESKPQQESKLEVSVH